MIRINNQPPSSLSAIRAALGAMSRQARRPSRPHDPGVRDVAFIEQIQPLLSLLYDQYFRCETELEAELGDGPMLLVGNHNGMSTTPDTICHMVAFWRRYGARRPAYGLAHDLAFNMPGMGSVLGGMGALAANHENAAKVLARGAAVLVFPGGDVEACRPFTQRYRIAFAGRCGFARLAIRAGVPIVPIVSAGAHHSLYMISDGQAIASALGLGRRFRSKTFPIALALPWGLTIGLPIAHLPLPVKIHTRILRPISPGLPPAAADDPAAVRALATRVVDTMQRELDKLRVAGRHGLFPKGL